jgi:hypothetical protein
LMLLKNGQSATTYIGSRSKGSSRRQEKLLKSR